MRCTAGLPDAMTYKGSSAFAIQVGTLDEIRCEERTQKLLFTHALSLIFLLKLRKV